MKASSVLRDVLKRDRQKYYVVTGAYNLLWGHPNLRRSLEKRLRQLGTKRREFVEDVRDEFYGFRDEGKVQAIGMSCHDREFAGQLVSEGALDVLVARYNAAHRGAEEDIFPFTATRWTYLLRRPRTWPNNGRVPTAGECYRFVLSNSNVNVCLAAFRQGPLADDDIRFMREFGDAVHRATQRGFR